jgi:hypothetical protein
MTLPAEAASLHESVIVKDKTTPSTITTDGGDAVLKGTITQQSGEYSGPGPHSQ